MKAYVIKNKEGKYFRGVSQPKSTNIPTRIYGRDICDAQIWEDEESVNFAVVASKNEYPQEITICEGDLENYIESIEKINDELTEERYIFKKALELACETIKQLVGKPAYICGGAIAERLGIPMTPEVKDYDYFIQQVKESEKDE